MPESLTADNGYFASDDIEKLENKTNLLVCVGKMKEGRKAVSPPEEDEEAQEPTTMQRMESKLRSEPGSEIYARRKEIVEPVFGQIKEGRGFRRFSFRGHSNVQHEWSLLCAVHNLLKLFRSGWTVCRS